ncbi:MAG: glycosyltransferase family 39 protein [Solirubrobacterales bacterium]|nr:glycosyltransferase family 39 protein [Solirubrobacterales bacterium]
MSETDRDEPGFETPLARFAPFILGAAIAASAVITMRLGRGATFTGDEIIWVVASPGMDLGTALQAHAGHLQLIPRAIYKLMLETVGLTYWPYRLLTVISMALVSVLLYRYVKRRTGAAVALIPSVLLLFFGSDSLHVIQGNGFTILFSVACGIAALLALDRRDLKGDLLACALLVCGVATYTVALPFVAGVGLAILISRSWRRLWIPAVPLLLYGGWRIWIELASTESRGGTLDLANVVHIPEWIFDSLSAILSAITGFGYGFTATTATGPHELIGPALAACALVAVGWRLSRGSIGSGVWVTMAIGFSLWTIQCLAADPSLAGYRAPSDPRYLYPGAVVVFMIAAELCAGKRWSRTAFVAVAAVAVFGIASNIAQLREYGSIARSDAREVTLGVTAAGIYFDEEIGKRVGPSRESVTARGAASIIASMALRPYGGIDYSPAEIETLPESERARIDRQLAGFQKIALAEDGLPTGRCRRLGRSPDGVYESPLPPGRAVIVAPDRPERVGIARFAETETVDLGEIPAGARRSVVTPVPVDGPPWRVSVSRAGAKICPAGQ